MSPLSRSKRGMTWDALLLTVACGILIITSVYQLKESPGVWYDEGVFLQTALNFAQTGTQSLQVAPGAYVSSSSVTVGFPLLAPLAFFFSAFGVGLLQARILMVFFLVGLFFSSYFLVRKICGPRFASLTALLLATLPIVYGNGKSVLGEVPGLFFLFLALAAFLYVERGEYKNLWHYAVLGVATGLCVATKPIFILLLPALGASMLLRREIVRQKVFWTGVGIAATVFLLVLALWVYLQFGGTDTLSGVLSFYLNPYEYKAGGMLTLVVHNIYGLFTDTTPLYFVGMLFIWATALWLRFRKREQITSAETTAFVFCVAVLVSYLRLPSWYRYFFPGLVVALVFFSSSVSYVIRFIFARMTMVFAKRSMSVAAAICLLLALAQGVQLFHGSYIAGFYHSTRTAQLESYFGNLSTSTSIFFYQVPEAVFFYPSRNYYQYLAPHPALQLGGDTVWLLTQGKIDTVVMNGETYAAQASSTLFLPYRLARYVDRYAVLIRR